MSSTDLLMRCCSFSSWRSPATDVRQTMPSNRFESQVIHSQFPGAVPFSRKQPPQPDFPKVPTGFPKVLREFSKVLTGFSKVLTVFPKVPTVFFRKYRLRASFLWPATQQCLMSGENIRPARSPQILPTGRTAFKNSRQSKGSATTCRAGKESPYWHRTYAFYSPCRSASSPDRKSWPAGPPPARKSVWNWKWTPAVRYTGD